MTGGPAAALRLVDALTPDSVLDQYLHFHCTRGELLMRLERDREARAAYGRALGLAGNSTERRFIERRLAGLDSGW